MDSAQNMETQSSENLGLENFTIYLQITYILLPYCHWSYSLGNNTGLPWSAALWNISRYPLDLETLEGLFPRLHNVCSDTLTCGICGRSVRTTLSCPPAEYMRRYTTSPFTFLLDAWARQHVTDMAKLLFSTCKTKLPWYDIHLCAYGMVYGALKCLGQGQCLQLYYWYIISHKLPSIWYFWPPCCLLSLRLSES